MKSTQGFRRHFATIGFATCFITVWLFATLYIYDAMINPNLKTSTTGESAVSNIESEKIWAEKFSEQIMTSARSQQASTVTAPKRLIFYNKPPKTGSTTVRVAMNRALQAKGMTVARCFKHVDWNDYLYKTIINQRNIDFWGCHIRLTKERMSSINSLRNGNVTYITGTRAHDKIILSSYLQENRDRKISEITDPVEMDKEVERYKAAVERYPVDALYTYHGGSVPLKSCPITWAHERSLNEALARYEAIIDLENPKESAAMIEIVTGLKPDFEISYNERTTHKTAMLERLEAVDTSHKDCGNKLVHKLLKIHFNMIKDRMMQNLCFDEGDGTYELCNKVQLTAEGLVERDRKGRHMAHRELMKL